MIPLYRHNLIVAKAMAISYSLLHVTSTQQVQYGMSQDIQCTHHRLTIVLLCVPFLYADSPECRFVVVYDSFCKRKLSVFSVATGLIAKVLHLQLFICNVAGQS